MRPRIATLVAVHVPSRTEADVTRSLEELTHLVEGLGLHVEPPIVQRRPSPDPKSYVGGGKLKEIASRTGGSGALTRGPDEPSAPSAHADERVVVIDDELSAAQQRNLEEACGVPVLDRTTVILQVFAARAKSRVAQLEVEIARLEHELPRIREDRSLSDKEGGGGRASRGASNVELKKQAARQRIASRRRELEALHRQQDRQRSGRRDGVRVALVGYTNTGKSSLLNALTSSDVLVEDKLFATLGTTVRRLAIKTTPEVMVADTVGFLHRLPHGLIDSFRSTMEEARDAQLLLHVVDASDPLFREQRRVTAEVLRELGATAPIWLVLNKIDRVSSEERAALLSELPDAIAMSAHARRDVVALMERIVSFVGARVAGAVQLG